MSIANHAIAERAVAHGPVVAAKTSGNPPKRRIVAQRDETLTPEPR